MQNKLLIVVAVLLSLALIGNGFQYCQGPKVVKVVERVDTTKIKQQFKTELEMELKAKLKPVIKNKKASVPVSINLDSLREEIDQYWIAKIQAMNPDVLVKPTILNNYDYSADGKIAITDSTDKEDTIATANMRYLSRIPLDPEGKFTMFGSWYYRSITHTTETTITEQKTFWQKLFGGLNYSVNCSWGQGMFTKQFDFYIGFGISYNIKSVF